MKLKRCVFGGLRAPSLCCCTIFGRRRRRRVGWRFISAPREGTENIEMEGITTIWSSFTFVLGHSTVDLVELRVVFNGLSGKLHLFDVSHEDFSSSSAATKRIRAFGRLGWQSSSPLGGLTEAIEPRNVMSSADYVAKESVTLFQQTSGEWTSAVSHLLGRPRESRES